MAKVTVDGKEMEVEEGANLFEVCEQARGQKLPHFCYHPGLPVVGVCRMCQVEIEGMPKLQIACNTQVRDGMVVNTRAEKVQQAVQQILEFHLLHHPVDCPVCDQAGECALQDQYMNYGLYDADIAKDDKLPKDKVKPIGDLVMLDAERCVLCARCTRFTDVITKTHELGIFNRGNHSEIDVAPGKTLDNNYSLNTVDICPVGALTSRDFRFKKRVWWLEVTDSICPGCATGCNMTIHHHENKAHRFKPRHNAEVNDYWMCDHGRLLYKQINQERLEMPLVRDGAEGAAELAGWDHAYRSIEARLAALGESRRLVTVGSPHATLEELYALEQLTKGVSGAKNLGYRIAATEMGEDDGLLFSADRTPNAAGARQLGMAEFSSADLKAAAAKDVALVILGNDLAGLDVEAAASLTGFGLVIYLGARMDATARLADVTLPAAVYAEKDGTFVNKTGHAQRLHKALSPPGEAKEPWRLLMEVGELLGADCKWTSVAELRGEVASRLGQPEGVEADRG